MALSLDQWQTRLDAYLAAELAVLANQEYEMETGTGRRKLRRADLSEIRAGIDQCNAMVARLTPAGARSRTFYVEPE